MEGIGKLESLFEGFARGQNYAAAFSEMLDLFLAPFRLYGTEDERSVAFGAMTGHPRREQLIRLYGEIGELSEGFGDPIGHLYERHVSKGRNGQFFTPQPLCRLMASLAGVDRLDDGKAVHDPACGSGRMLLAAASINRNLRLYGADIDLVCCKMSAVNMLLNSLTGEIAHMDSLGNEFFRGYQLGTILRGGYHHPYVREFTDPDESRIWLRTSSELQKGNAPDAKKPPSRNADAQADLFSE